MTDVYIVETRERYSGDTEVLAIAASFDAARSFVRGLVRTQQDVGLWTQQDQNKWRIELSYTPDSRGIAAYTITRWPVIESVNE
jgi:hypothetical protein